MRIYGYLRASTKDQDAERAKPELEAFAKGQGYTVDAWFIENESGATLKRPELFRLLEIAQPSDVLLVEQVDRISRLNAQDWESLKTTLIGKGIKVVALDLPTSHQLMQTGDEFTERMFAAINSMMLDMLAAIARKDYEDRRKRQAQGVQRAKAEGKYPGKPENKKLQAKISDLLKLGKSYNEIIDFLGCSRGTIAKVSKQLKASIQPVE